MTGGAPRAVLYLSSSAGRYGADRQLALIARGLDPARYRALVVLPHDGPLVGELRAAGIDVRVRSLAVLRRAEMSPAGLGRVAAAWAADAGGLGRIARREGVALVHTNTSVTLGGAAAARIAGIPHVWHVREIFTGFERWWPAYRRLLVTGSSAIPCVSAATQAQFDGHAAASVLHDGLAVVPRRAERDVARAQLGIDADVPALALLGRISTWKGQDVLIRALADPSLRARGAIALLAGDVWPGEERRERELRALARRIGVEGRVRWLGFRDDVDTVYGAADLVVVPSTQPDPFPNSALEAAAAGCCVVAAAHGGLPEMLDDGATAVLVPPGDARALARACAELLDDPSRAREIGARAADEIPARFGPERLLADLHDRYDALVATGR